MFAACLFAFAQSGLKFNMNVDEDSSLLSYHTDQWIQSNAFPQSMVSDYLLRSRFQESSIQHFKDKEQMQLRSQVFSQNTISYLTLKENGSRSFRLNYNNNWFLQGERDLYDLGIFGNADYEGETVTSRPVDLINYSYLSLQYGESSRSKAGYRFAWNAGISVFTKSQKFTADQLSFFTAAGGRKLSIDANNINWSRPSDGIDAIGLDLDLYLHKTIGNFELGISMEDFNINYGFGNVFKIDTLIDFQGLELTGDDLISGDLNSIADSIVNKVLYSDSSKAAFGLLPFRNQLSLSRDINASQRLGIEITTWTLGKYGWSLGAWHQAKFGQNFRLKSAIGYGNFSGLWWSESAAYNFGSYQVQLSLHGAHHLLLPSSSGLTGFSFGLAKAW